MGLIGMATVFISKFKSKVDQTADHIDDKGVNKLA